MYGVSHGIIFGPYYHNPAVGLPHNDVQISNLNLDAVACGIEIQYLARPGLQCTNIKIVPVDLLYKIVDEKRIELFNEKEFICIKKVNHPWNQVPDLDPSLSIVNGYFGAQSSGPCISWEGKGRLMITNCLFYDWNNKPGNILPCPAIWLNGPELNAVITSSQFNIKDQFRIAVKAEPSVKGLIFVGNILDKPTLQSQPDPPGKLILVGNLLDEAATLPYIQAAKRKVNDNLY